MELLEFFRGRTGLVGQIAGGGHPPLAVLLHVDHRVTVPLGRLAGRVRYRRGPVFDRQRRTEEPNGLNEDFDLRLGMRLEDLGEACARWPRGLGRSRPLR